MRIRQILLAGVLGLLVAQGGPTQAPVPAALPPVPGPVVRAFDPPSNPYGPGHRGVKLAARPAEDVRSALPGVVAFSGQVARQGWVSVDHGGGLRTTYGLLDPRVVVAGQRVGAGQLLGQLSADAGELHWGARLNGVYVDPMGLLGQWRVRLAEHR